MSKSKKIMKKQSVILTAIKGAKFFILPPLIIWVLTHGTYLLELAMKKYSGAFDSPTWLVGFIGLTAIVLGVALAAIVLCVPLAVLILIFVVRGIQAIYGYIKMCSRFAKLPLTQDEFDSVTEGMNVDECLSYFDNAVSYECFSDRVYYRWGALIRKQISFKEMESVFDKMVAKYGKDVCLDKMKEKRMMSILGEYMNVDRYLSKQRYEMKKLNENGVHGFKVLGSNWSCEADWAHKKQYTCPGRFEEDVEPEVCGPGMHFCEKAVDCFRYYPFDPENKVVEVIAYGKVVTDGVKSCTDKLEIVREIPWEEVLRIVNMGKNCTGDSNTGDRNTGDWNKSSFNTGCFMTEEQKIMFFNKPSDWTYNDWLRSDARYLLNQAPKKVDWIYLEDMTDEEKAEHPTRETTGGYLKVLDESDCGQLWWDSLPDHQKDTIKALPNFDPEIFEQCTGIKIGQPVKGN